MICARRDLDADGRGIPLSPGEWVSDPSQATHIVFSSETPPPSPSGSSNQEYFRTLARVKLSKGREVSLIHVWYRPDSYDSWLPAADFADPEPEPPAKDGQPWLVATRWLRDSVRYNELMNEEDYEKEDDENNNGAEPVTTAATQSSSRR